MRRCIRALMPSSHPWHLVVSALSSLIASVSLLTQANWTGSHNNNYNRPSGQNVDNFLTDRPSSRVLAPPGGASSLRLG
jgi:protein SPIRAL1 and related proteins